MENHSLDSRVIGRAENVQAAECTQRFNAKIGHALFHSLYQHDTKKYSLRVFTFLKTPSMVDC